MKICINALAASLGGGFTYVANMVPNLGLPPGERHTFILLLARGFQGTPSVPDNVRCVYVRIPFGNTVLRVAYEQFLLPLFLFFWRVDLLFSPQDMTTLAAPCKVVLAMRNPNLYTRLKQGWRPKDALRILVLGVLARLSFYRASRTIFVSEDSRQWISKNVNFPLKKSVVVHHGIDLDAIAQQPQMDVKAQYDIKRPYILSVSTVYRYKNYVRLIEAYAELCRDIETHDLVIVGKNVDPPYFEQMQQKVESLEMSDRIFLIQGVDYRYVFSFYRQADLFVFPSYLETFGHPLLEAMALDVPVVAADIGVFREIAGSAALFFDPFDCRDMAQKMCLVLQNEEIRQDLILEGMRQRKLFSWLKTAQETIAVFDDVLAS